MSGFLENLRRQKQEQEAKNAAGRQRVEDQIAREVDVAAQRMQREDMLRRQAREAFNASGIEDLIREFQDSVSGSSTESTYWDGNGEQPYTYGKGVKGTPNAVGSIVTWDTQIVKKEYWGKLVKSKGLVVEATPSGLLLVRGSRQISLSSASTRFQQESALEQAFKYPMTIHGRESLPSAPDTNPSW